VEYQIKNPNLTDYDSMKLADFSLQEREDKAKYMMVIRLLNKTKKDDFVTPPAQLSITVSRSSSDLISSVTMSADGGGTSAPAKKAKRVRSTATAKQMLRKAAYEKKNEYNTAFKRATIVYAREKGKDDGLSARKVANMIKTIVESISVPERYKRR
jgi:multidrug efflux pump subunit AcrB